jgi:hypothetical protein
MARPPLSLAVVGADFPNPDNSNRRFEIAMCKPGEEIELRPEPRNKADPNAIAVYSKRGVQIGYLRAERAPLLRRIILSGQEVQCVFQENATYGAVVRAAFDGDTPTIPMQKPSRPQWGGDDTFWADETYDDYD